MNIVEHYKAGSTPTEVAMDALGMLKKQGSRGYDHDKDECVYYEPSTGCMCVVGLLLPDAKLALGLDTPVGRLASTIKRKYGGLSDLDELEEAIDHYIEILNPLQEFHDHTFEDSYTHDHLTHMIPRGLLREVEYSIGNFEEESL